MTMKMHRAFNPKMEVQLTVVSTSSGHYNEDNDYIGGRKESRTIRGVLTLGNKKSHLEAGIARHSTPSGQRFSDYRNLYINHNRYGALTLDDKVIFGCVEYQVIQKGDQNHFGFSGYFLERDIDHEKEGGRY